MFSVPRFRYALVASIALLLPLQGQQSSPAFPKHIFPSRSNVTPTTANQSTGGGIGQLATAGNGITYHGGPLMLGTPNVYYIWYGNWASDPTGITILQHFIQFEGGSPYYGINTTYYDGSSTHISNSINFGPSYSDNYSRGKVLGDADILAIVSAAITGGHLPSDPNGVYFVLTWQDVQETSGFITQYCGWHSNDSVGGVDIKYAFVGNAATQGLGSCAAQTISSPNGDPGPDGMASVIAHELEESTSDPDLNAWYDNAGNENADKCAWTYGTMYSAINGSSANMNLGGFDYLIQRNWVNASGGYCALSLPNAPTLTASINPSSGAANSTVPVTITGTNLSGGTINISGTGVSASNVSTGATQITATFAIAANATAGVRNVTVTTAGGTSNAETFTVVAAQVATPTFAPPGGTYGSTQNVIISTTTAGASTRYTTDGSTPSSTVGTLYAGAVSVGSNVTLKAIAYESGFADSGVSTAAYTINTSGGWPNGYSYRRAITIDHTKVPNTDQTNFPVLVSGTFAYLAGAGSGGNVSSANGYDIIFTSDATGGSVLSFEQESYSSSSGKVAYWVKIPTLSHTTDTVIYMFYGNPAVTVDTSNKTAVWDSNYKLIYHMADNAANKVVADSSANANNVIDSANTNSKSLTAQIGAGLTYASGSSDEGTTSNPVTLGSAATFSLWFKAGSFGGYARLLETNYANSYFLGMNASGTKFYWIVNSGHGAGCGDGYGSACTSTALTPGTWYYIAGTFNGTTARIYLNGAQEGTDTPTAPSSQSLPLYINRYVGGGYREDGVYDEVRLSSIARSSDWIAAEFANQSSPGTFFAVGAQQSGTSSQAATPTFNPPAGNYVGTQSVIISTTTGGTSIRYTTDGSTPSSTVGTPYAGAVLVSSNQTLKAIAYGSGLTDSAIGTAAYTIQAATPTFNPPAGNYVGTQSVIISTTTGGTLIRYTTDGSTPSSTVGTLYAGAVLVSSNQTLKAIAYGSGLTDSAIATAAYTITSSGAWSNGYSYRRTITIDHTKVPNTDQANFPVLLSGTYADLASVGSGGNVTNVNGYDIVFTSDPAGSSALAFERESYSSTSGKVAYWVKVPTLSHSADTVIYMFYGNPAVTVDTSNKTAVWDSNYKLVYHMADNAGTAVVADSSANANNAIDTANTNAKSVTAEIGTGLTYANASGDEGATSSPVTLGTTATFSLWFKAGSFTSYARLLETNFATSYYLGMNGSATKFYWIVKGGSGAGCGDGYGSACTSTALIPGTWYYITATFDGTTAKIYLNGAQEGTDTPAAPSSQSMPLYINRYPGGGYREDGAYDEVRLSSIARSSDWIAAEFANQNSPGTFFSVGAQQTSEGLSQAATPTFNPPAGTYIGTQSVMINTTTGGTSIRYTTDGSTPSSTVGTLYAGAVPVSSSQTLKAIAYGSGLTDSPVASAAYVIQAATPAFNPPGGSYSSAQSVVISSTAGASIRYTTDGSTPSSTVGTLYAGAVLVSSSSTLKAIAYGSGLTDSAVSTAAYIINTGGGWPNGYSYRRAITIDHTKVPNTDQTNFPVLVSGTYAYLASLGNGGSVTNVNGFDIIFTSDPAGSSALPFERESYSSSGKVAYWVNVPTLSHTTDTAIYMFYGNPGVTVDTSNKTAVWDSNYKLIYHMADNATTTAVADSSANANNAINVANTNSKSLTAQIGAGLTYANASGDEGTTSSPVTLGTTATFSLWFKAGSFTSYARLLETSFATSYYLGMNASATKFYWVVNGGSGGGCADYFGGACTSTALTTGAWYYITGTFDGTTAKIYLNGAQQGTDTPHAAPVSQSLPFYLNRYFGGGYREDGAYDEVRVSNIARSSDWIATEFANQNSPSTFFSVGAQQ